MQALAIIAIVAAGLVSFILGLVLAFVTRSRFQSETVSFPRIPDPFADKTKCDDCGCWIDKHDSRKVKIYFSSGMVTNYYCGTHKKPYSEIRSTRVNFKYYNLIEVDKNGVPLGYTKTKIKVSKD